jgi:hypothetical protein
VIDARPAGADVLVAHSARRLVFLLAACGDGRRLWILETAPGLTAAQGSRGAVGLVVAWSMTDRMLDAGRTVHGLAPSTYEATLATSLTAGYPMGSLLPPAAGSASRPVAADDVHIAYPAQPYQVEIYAPGHSAATALVAAGAVSDRLTGRRDFCRERFPAGRRGRTRETLPTWLPRGGRPVVKLTVRAVSRCRCLLP